VRDACASLAPDAGLAIRWPNDVVEGTGRKVAGLLVETAIEHSALAEAVVGIGINVNWLPVDMPAEIRGSATSLQVLRGEPIDRVELLDHVPREARRILDLGTGDGAPVRPPTRTSRSPSSSAGAASCGSGPDVERWAKRTGRL